MLTNNPLIYLAKKTWEYSAGNRRNVVVFLILFAIANIISFFEPIILAKFINVIQQDVVKNSSVSREGFIYSSCWLSLLVVIELMFWAPHGTARVLERINSFLVRANCKRYLLRGVHNFPMQWHVEHHTGDTSDKIEKGSYAMFGFSEGSFEIIEMLATLIGSLIALIYFNPYSSYLVIFMALLAAVIVIRFDRILIPQYRALNRAENKILERVIDAITNIRTIIILRIEKYILETIDRKIMEPFELFKKNCKINEYKWFLVSLVTSLSMFWVLTSFVYYSSKMHLAIEFGTIVALIQYTSRINGTFFRFAEKYSNIVRQRASVSNAEEIADEFKAQKKTAPITLNGDWGKLKIRSLSFSYHTKEGADLHLDNVSLDIRRGERIALIGSTGSGKSTLLMIIRDLYSPQAFQLCLDDRPICDGFKAISSEIALIPQDPEILSTTIRENITSGIECEMPEMLKYTDLACFTDVVLNLPNKFDSTIREKGVNLSGGEKQRLALARGLMASRDKSIVLLDEPTSSVDVATEQRVFENIFKAFADKTIICSLHSLHLLPLFDQIYLFNDGAIIAGGTFDGLLESSGEFKNLWDDFIRDRDQNANRNGNHRV